MNFVQPRIIASPVTGSPCRPKIVETERDHKIYEEAHWYCPDSGQFIMKGVISVKDKKGNLLSEEYGYSQNGQGLTEDSDDKDDDKDDDDKDDDDKDDDDKDDDKDDDDKDKDDDDKDDDDKDDDEKKSFPKKKSSPKKKNSPKSHESLEEDDDSPEEDDSWEGYDKENEEGSGDRLEDIYAQTLRDEEGEKGTGPDGEYTALDMLGMSPEDFEDGEEDSQEPSGLSITDAMEIAIQKATSGDDPAAREIAIEELKEVLDMMTDLNIRGDKYRLKENDELPPPPEEIGGPGGLVAERSKCKMHFEKYYESKKLKNEDR